MKKKIYASMFVALLLISMPAISNVYGQETQTTNSNLNLEPIDPNFVEFDIYQISLLSNSEIVNLFFERFGVDQSQLSSTEFLLEYESLQDSITLERAIKNYQENFGVNPIELSADQIIAQAEYSIFNSIEEFDSIDYDNHNQNAFEFAQTTQSLLQQTNTVISGGPSSLNVNSDWCDFLRGAQITASLLAFIARMLGLDASMLAVLGSVLNIIYIMSGCNTAVSSTVSTTNNDMAQYNNECFICGAYLYK